MTMRSPLWYVVGAVIALAGFVGALVYTVPPMLKALDLGLVRMTGPGSEIVTLDRAGAYTLYFENRGFVDGEFIKSDVPAGLKITLTSEKTGEAIKLGDTKGSFTYSTSEHSGRAILGFTIAEPGRYRLSATLPPGRRGAKFVLAIGYGEMSDIVSHMFRTIMMAVAFSLASLGIGGIIIAVTAIQRDKAKRAAT